MVLCDVPIEVLEEHKSSNFEDKISWVYMFTMIVHSKTKPPGWSFRCTTTQNNLRHYEACSYWCVPVYPGETCKSMVAQCSNVQNSHEGHLPQPGLVQCRNPAVGNDAVHKHVDGTAQTEDARRWLGICWGMQEQGSELQEFYYSITDWTAD